MVLVRIPIPNVAGKSFLYALAWDETKTNMPTPLNFARSIAVDFNLDEAAILIIAAEVEEQIAEYRRDPFAEKWRLREKKYRSNPCITKVHVPKVKTDNDARSARPQKRRRSSDGAHKCKFCNKTFLLMSDKSMHEASHKNGGKMESCKLGATGSFLNLSKSTPEKKIKKMLKDRYDTSMAICGKCFKGGRMFCCDECPAVYHHRCLRLAGPPKGDWSCDWCSTSDAEKREKVSRAAKRSVEAKCRAIMETIRQHDYAYFFEDPVVGAPGYEIVVKEPKCFQDIEINLNEGKYDDTWSGFTRDMRLIWSNCMAYNQQNTGLWRIANIFSAYFEGYISD